MMAKINLFAAWYLIAQIFLHNILDTIGTWLLYTLGMPAPLHEQFGWLVGALMLLSVLLIIRNVMGELPPGVGKPEGKGYRLGHRVLFVSSMLAFSVYVLALLVHKIQNEFILVTATMFVTDFAYIAMAIFGVGISLIYQSGQPVATNSNP